LDSTRKWEAMSKEAVERKMMWYEQQRTGHSRWLGRAEVTLGTTQWPTVEHRRIPLLYSPQAGVSLLALLYTSNCMKGFQSSVERTEHPSR
jgi:hypothetical protein